MIQRLHKDDGTRVPQPSTQSVEDDASADRDGTLQQEFSDLLSRATTHFGSTSSADSIGAALVAAGTVAPTVARKIEHVPVVAKREVDDRSMEAPLDASKASSKNEGRPIADLAGAQTNRAAPDETSKQPATHEQSDIPMKQGMSDADSKGKDSTESQNTPILKGKSDSAEPVPVASTAADKGPVEGAVTEVIASDEEGSAPPPVALPAQGVPAASDTQQTVAQTKPDHAVKGEEKPDAVSEIQSSSTASKSQAVAEIPVSPAAPESLTSSKTEQVQQATDQSDGIPEKVGEKALATAALNAALIAGNPKNVTGGAAAGDANPSSTVSRSDAAIQMTLLRQAFESVKSAAGEIKTHIPQAQAPQGIAMMASSEAQTSRSDVTQRNAPRVPLTRNAVSRTLERVESALREAARSKDGKTLSFRLDPPQLGQVKVDVTMRDGGLHARLTPENQQVTAMLRENSHELQSSLRRLGLNVETISVSVGSEWSQAGGEELNLSSEGKSFQQDRNNMPGEEGQVPETTFGNELAPTTLGDGTTSISQLGINDHWVA